MWLKRSKRGFLTIRFKFFYPPPEPNEEVMMMLKYRIIQFINLIYYLIKKPPKKMLIDQCKQCPDRSLCDFEITPECFQEAIFFINRVSLKIIKKPVIYTCHFCSLRDTCQFAFDPYNEYPDCLAEK